MVTPPQDPPHRSPRQPVLSDSHLTNTPPKSTDLALPLSPSIDTSLGAETAADPGQNMRPDPPPDSTPSSTNEPPLPTASTTEEEERLPRGLKRPRSSMNESEDRPAPPMVISRGVRDQSPASRLAQHYVEFAETFTQSKRSLDLALKTVKEAIVAITQTAQAEECGRIDMDADEPRQDDGATEGSAPRRKTDSAMLDADAAVDAETPQRQRRLVLIRIILHVLRVMATALEVDIAKHHRHLDIFSRELLAFQDKLADRESGQPWPSTSRLDLHRRRLDAIQLRRDSHVTTCLQLVSLLLPRA